MVKAIIFDLQGTLVENGVFPSPSKQVKRILRINEPFHSYILRFEKIFMTKKFDSLKDAFAAVCADFRLHPPEFVIENLVGVWNKNKLLSKIFPETVAVLTELKKEYKLILVANIDCFSKDIVEKFSLNQYFDEIILSCDTGMLKSDPAYFEHALSKVGVSKEDAILVGDSMESDIEAAKRAGIVAVLVDRQDRREYSEKIISLDQLSKFLK